MKKHAKQTVKVSANRVRASRKGRKVTQARDELRAHYDFDYSQARPNRFASRFSGDKIAVVLDGDVASVFHSSEAVNSFLRSAISATRQHAPRKRKRA
jgi:hypothetical protein